MPTFASPSSRIDTMMQMLHDHGVSDVEVTMLTSSLTMCDAHVLGSAFKQVLANMVMPDGTEAPGVRVEQSAYSGSLFFSRVFLDKDDVFQLIFSGTRDEVQDAAPSAFARWANAQVQPDPTHLL